MNKKTRAIAGFFISWMGMFHFPGAQLRRLITAVGSGGILYRSPLD